MLQWLEILQIAQTLHLSSESDTFVWKFEPNGVFSVKSMYAMRWHAGNLEEIGMHPCSMGHLAHREHKEKS
jgi:hypothetical protein